MRRVLLLTPLLGLPLILASLPAVDAACCYFSAKDKDVNQPAQKAYITWNPTEQVETFTVQPKFEGNALDFGMVIPTPGKPKLDEMPRDFFKMLAVFTILEPMDINKYKNLKLYLSRAGAPGVAKSDAGTKPTTVKVLEEGVVGSLDYKIITAEKPDDLYVWLKDNKYTYSGDESTLGFYIKKKWFFTVMKIDTKQMKRNADGSFAGEVTPTRFQFASEKPVYPLKITQISVKDKTEALFYVQAPHKVDLPGAFSYQFTFTPMWNQATTFALPEKLTTQEVNWQKHVQPQLGELTKQGQQIAQKKHTPATLEWAKKITETDMGVMDGTKPYNRNAPKEDVDKLKLLKGHVVKGQFITKFRKVFAKDEMADDLEIVRARLNDKDDDIEYYQILPTSPP